MEHSHNNQVAFVTGSGSGIGRAIAQGLARSGARVSICDRDARAAEETAESIRAEGGAAIAETCDVSIEEELNEAIDSTAARLGPIEILVNNAGFQRVSAVEVFPTEVFESMLRVMVTAPFIAMKRVLPAMKERGRGRIISIASINGLVGFAGKSGYNAAKHGLIGLTKVVALETARFGITVNALCPGYVDTPLVRNQLGDLAKSRNVPLEKALEDVLYPLIPQRRLLDLSEVVDYALFLASDRARGVTGQAVVLDGGYTAQ